MASAFENLAPRFIHDFCRVLDCRPWHGAGVAGNINEESGFKAIQEHSPIAGRGGFGWVQWTGPRRVAFENWCKLKGLDPTSYEANFGFLVYELQTTHKESLRYLKMTTTAKAAAETFGYHFERFLGFENLNSDNYRRRVVSAERALVLYLKSPYYPKETPVPTPTPIPTPLPGPSKPWYQSQAVIGGVIAVMSALLGRFIPGLASLDPNAAAATLLNWIEVLGPIIGGAMAVNGRLRATQPVSGTQAAQTAQNAIDVARAELPPGYSPVSPYSPNPIAMPDTTPDQFTADDVFRIIMKMPWTELAALATKAEPVMKGARETATKALEQMPETKRSTDPLDLLKQ